MEENQAEELSNLTKEGYSSGAHKVLEYERLYNYVRVPVTHLVKTGSEAYS